MTWHRRKKREEVRRSSWDSGITHVEVLLRRPKDFVTRLMTLMSLLLPVVWNEKDRSTPKNYWDTWSSRYFEVHSRYEYQRDPFPQGPSRKRSFINMEQLMYVSHFGRDEGISFDYRSPWSRIRTRRVVPITESSSHRLTYRWPPYSRLRGRYTRDFTTLSLQV